MRASSVYADAGDDATDDVAGAGVGGDETQWTARSSEDGDEEAHESESDVDLFASELSSDPSPDNDDERGDKRSDMTPTVRSEEANDADDSEGEEDTDSNELSVDSLPAELATGRTGVDELLESMFTERTVENMTRADGESESETEELGDYDHRGVEEETAARGRPLEQFEEGVQHDDQENQVIRNIEGVQEQPSPYETTESLRESQAQTSAMDYTAPHISKRAIEATRSPRHAIAHVDSTGNPALRIITFDVGGTLFRCKESLIRKYPLKRLNQVISCGCEKIGHDTFFIDRNPQHFEVILDWYRTGSYVRHPHMISEEALQEDAKYFDLYQELFSEKIRPAPQVDRMDHVVPNQASQPPRVPPRPHRQQEPPQQVSPGPAPAKSVLTEGRSSVRLPEGSKPKLQERSRDSDPISEELNGTGDDETLRFCKSEYRTIEADGIPVVYMVRKHEHLLVVSVKGCGKLLVRVCDTTGMQAVHVPSAVLFDSQSYFYLQGGRAKLQHCLLPGGHTYTFWMEIDPMTPAAIAPSQSKNNSAKAVRHELDVEFKLLSTFRMSEQLTDSLDEELQVITASGAAEVFSAPNASPTASTDQRMPSFSPYMFLPPRYQQQQQSRSQCDWHDDQANGPGSKLREVNRECETTTGSLESNEQDGIAKQLFPQSSPTSVAGRKNSDSSSPSGVINKAPATLSPSGKASKKNGAGANSSSSQAQSQSSAIKRNGAAIVSGGSKPAGSNNNSTHNDKQAGKITIYQHTQLKIEESPRESIASSPRSTSSSSTTKKLEVATKYKDHQPRLFR